MTIATNEPTGKSANEGASPSGASLRKAGRTALGTGILLLALFLLFMFTKRGPWLFDLMPAWLAIAGLLVVVGAIILLAQRMISVRAPTSLFRRQAATLLIAMGAMALAAPLLRLFVWQELPPFAVLLVAGMALSTGGVALLLSRRAESPHMAYPWSWRKAAVVAVAAGSVLALTYSFALPPVRGEALCKTGGLYNWVQTGGWIVIRDPDFGGGMVAYDAVNDTTLLLPGCGNDDKGVALRVQGDHRDFGQDGRNKIDWMVLVPHGVTEPTNHTVPRSAPGREGEGPLPVLEGTFTVSTLAGHVALYVGVWTLAALAAGLAREGRPNKSSLIPAVGVLAACALSFWAVRLDPFSTVMVGVPFVVMPTFFTGIVGMLSTRGRSAKFPWFLAAFLFSVVCCWTFVEFGGLFPARGFG